MHAENPAEVGMIPQLVELFPRVTALRSWLAVGKTDAVGTGREGATP